MSCSPPPAIASEAVSSSIAPVLVAYNSSVASVLEAQASLESRLKAVLAELASAQASHSAGSSAEIVAYAGRVEALRRKLEGVESVMSRVQGRLQGLQTAVTAVELREIEDAKRSAAAAASGSRQ